MRVFLTGATGFQLAAAARKHREALYVGDGANRWCGVHRVDGATLFRLALESGTAGRVYHGVGDEACACVTSPRSPVDAILSSSSAVATLPVGRWFPLFHR